MWHELEVDVQTVDCRQAEKFGWVLVNCLESAVRSSASHEASFSGIKEVQFQFFKSYGGLISREVEQILSLNRADRNSEWRWSFMMR